MESCMASDQERPLLPQREDDYTLITERMSPEEMLQRAQRLEGLGVLAGGIAHDLNNLLTGIFGYISLAKEKIERESDAAHYLDNAISTFNSAQSLTRQLLTCVKGGITAKTTISLSSLLRENSQLALSGSNVSSELDIPHDLWNCDADKYQIEQVLHNILINARQAMPHGGNIVISARNVPDGALLPPSLLPCPYVRISISDQGIGIPKDILPRIFDPFFTTKPQGSGLGLATAYSIIKKHGGHIQVDSEVLKGATFSIFLPATQSSVCVESSIPSLISHACHAKILVMDDQEEILAICQAILSHNGYAVTVATHGTAAINLYQKALSEQKPYDLVIVDLTIPGTMDGRRTMQELLKIDPSVKAIVSSGNPDDPILAEPHKYGFKGKLAKPYLTEALLRVIEHALIPPPPLLRSKHTITQGKRATIKSELPHSVRPFRFLAAAPAQVST
jgi:two-component system, cell cycle sensor histidine kinase and response regulator CckA